MDIEMSQERKKALLLGGLFGLLLCAVSLVAVTYFPNTQINDIGFLVMSPVFYMPLGTWQSGVLAFIYLVTFFSAYVSLLVSIKSLVYRISSAIVILGSVTVLHLIYAKLFFVQLFETLRSDVVIEAMLKVMSEHATK
jgi:hypothetical protein